MAITLNLSYEAETRCAEIEPDVYRILAAEVRALREDYADLEQRSLTALEQMTASAVTAITGAGVNADLAEQYAELRVEMEGWKEEAGDAEELRATIARVEALCDMQHEDSAVSIGDIRAALRGEP